MPNYFCVNFYTQDGKDKLEYGLSHKLWLMQYQYKVQETQGMTTSNWNTVKHVAVNDWIVAYSQNRFYAVGLVKAPRIKANYIDNVDRTINDKAHKYATGIIHYSDAQAFYENLNEDNGFYGEWGQRIDVEDWIFVNENGVVVPGLKAMPLT